MAQPSYYVTRNLRAIALGYTGYGQQRAVRKKVDEQLPMLTSEARTWLKRQGRKADIENVLEAKVQRDVGPSQKSDWDRLVDIAETEGDPKWQAYRKAYKKRGRQSSNNRR